MSASLFDLVADGGANVDRLAGLALVAVCAVIAACSAIRSGIEYVRRLR